MDSDLSNILQIISIIVTAIATVVIAIFSWKSNGAACAMNKIAEASQDRTKQLEEHLYKVRLKVIAQNRQRWKSNSNGRSGGTYENGKDIKGLLIENRGLFPVDILEIDVKQDDTKNSYKLIENSISISEGKEEFFPFKEQKDQAEINITYEEPNSGKNETMKKKFDELVIKKIWDDF